MEVAAVCGGIVQSPTVVYYGKVVQVYQDGDYKVLSVLNGTKRQKPIHVFAYENEAKKYLATGAVDASGTGASYIESNAQLAALVAEKSTKLKTAKNAHANAVDAKKQATWRQKQKHKHGLCRANQKAAKVVKRLECELKKTKGLADAQSKKSTEIIETLMLNLLQAEKKKDALERDSLKTKEISSKQWEIMKSMFSSEKKHK